MSGSLADYLVVVNMMTNVVLILDCVNVKSIEVLSHFHVVWRGIRRFTVKFS